MSDLTEKEILAEMCPTALRALLAVEDAYRGVYNTMHNVEEYHGHEAEYNLCEHEVIALNAAYRKVRAALGKVS